MTLEQSISLIRAIGLVIVYAIVGFGPGFILGVLFGNAFGGRGRDPLRKKHEENLKSAAEHNAQWHPSHKRWEN